MRVLFVHPSSLPYSSVFVRLEPLGLERVAAAAQAAGHDVRIRDLQVFESADFDDDLTDFRPKAVGFGLTYLANAPEVIELARRVKAVLPGCFVFVGGYSAELIASHMLEQAGGAIDAIVRGDGEPVIASLLAAGRDGAAAEIPGVITPDGSGPPPPTTENVDEPRPSRILVPRRESYFVGVLQPAACIEIRNRTVAPNAVAEELATIDEPGVYIVDDAAFVRPEHADAVAAAIERRKVRKQYCIQASADALLRHTDAVERWRRVGLQYVILTIDVPGESADADRNGRALAAVRSLGISALINLVVDPRCDGEQFRRTCEWALSVPEIVQLTVLTPYPDTAMWRSESRRLVTRDYRLFDAQHAVLPTALPLDVFYQTLGQTQAAINREHGLLADDDNPDRRYFDHLRPCRYELPTRLARENGSRNWRQLQPTSRTSGGRA